jgi:hypothetical protein
MLARLFEVSEARGKGKGLFARELVPKASQFSLNVSHAGR